MTPRRNNAPDASGELATSANRSHDTASTVDPLAAGGPNSKYRLAVSVLIALHVAAVFICPFAFACQVSNQSMSPFASGLYGLARPYSQALYLDHGYFFFAPDPGACHLVRYEVTLKGDAQPIIKTFPSLDDQWPRLLYHRHFMMAETLHNTYAPPTPPVEPTPPPANSTRQQKTQYNRIDLPIYREAKTTYDARREQHLALRGSMIKHLESLHPGGKVKLIRVEHRPLFPNEMTDLGKKLDAADTYTDLVEPTVAGGAQ